MRTPLFLTFRALFTSLALLLSANAMAGDWYLLGAVGTSVYRYPSEKIEAKMPSYEREGTIRKYSYRIAFEGEHRLSGPSRSSHIGLGYVSTSWWGVEIDWRRGFQMELDSSYRLTGEWGGRTFETGKIRFQQRATLEGIGLSVIGTYPLGHDISVTGRIGVFHGEAEHWLSFPGTTISLLLQSERGFLPIVGAGLLYRPVLGWAVTLEAQAYSAKSQDWKVGVRRYLNFL